MTAVSSVLDVIVGGLVGFNRSGVLSGQLCVLEECGRVRCWGTGHAGANGDGRLFTPIGYSAWAPSATPVDVLGLP